MRVAYLVAYVDLDSMQVVGVTTYSEPPWALTGAVGGSRTPMLLLRAEGKDYEDAVDMLHESYPLYAKRLSERFPLPPRSWSPRRPDLRIVRGTGADIGTPTGGDNDCG